MCSLDKLYAWIMLSFWTNNECNKSSCYVRLSVVLVFTEAWRDFSVFLSIKYSSQLTGTLRGGWNGSATREQSAGIVRESLKCNETVVCYAGLASQLHPQEDNSDKNQSYFLFVYRQQLWSLLMLFRYHPIIKAVALSTVQWHSALL